MQIKIELGGLEARGIETNPNSRRPIWRQQLAFSRGQHGEKRSRLVTAGLAGAEGRDAESEDRKARGQGRHQDEGFQIRTRLEEGFGDGSRQPEEGLWQEEVLQRERGDDLQAHHQRRDPVASEARQQLYDEPSEGVGIKPEDLWSEVAI